MEIAIEQIKTFSPDITQAFNNLLVQLKPDAKILKDEDVRKVIEGSSTYLLVARDTSKNKIIGMLTLIIFNAFSAKKGLLEDIVVDRNHRGRGIGAKLINEAINKARNEKVSYIDLTSRPEKIAANDLYQRLGFKKRDTNAYRIEL